MKNFIEIILFVNFVKKIISNKVRDHSYQTGENRGPAHNKCNGNFKQKQSIYIPFNFHNFGNYDCHLLVEKLVDKKNDEVKFDFISQTNEEYLSVTYGCVRFIDSFRFLFSSLISLDKTLVDNSHKTRMNWRQEIVGDDNILHIVNVIEAIFSKDKYNNESTEDLKKNFPDEIEKLEEALNNYRSENDLKFLKTEFPDKWKFLNKNLVYPYEFFISVNDYQKPVDNLNNKISSVK